MSSLRFSTSALADAAGRFTELPARPSPSLADPRRLRSATEAMAADRVRVRGALSADDARLPRGLRLTIDTFAELDASLALAAAS